MDSSRVLLGTCKSVHGIKGAVVFNLFNDESSVLEAGMNIYTSKEGDEKLQIRDINFTNKVIVYLNKIEDRSAAESIIPFDIYLDRDAFPKISDDEVYLNDLIGFKVINEAGKDVGVINSFYSHGASDIAVILLKNSDELELPFVKSFFPSIDFNKSQITMLNPEVLWKLEKSGY